MRLLLLLLQMLLLLLLLLHPLLSLLLLLVLQLTLALHLLLLQALHVLLAVLCVFVLHRLGHVGVHFHQLSESRAVRDRLQVEPRAVLLGDVPNQLHLVFRHDVLHQLEDGAVDHVVA